MRVTRGVEDNRFYSFSWLQLLWQYLLGAARAGLLILGRSIIYVEFQTQPIFEIDGIFYFTIIIKVNIDL